MKFLHLDLCVWCKRWMDSRDCELCGSWPACVTWSAYSKVYFVYRVKHESQYTGLSMKVTYVNFFLRRLHKIAALKIFRQTYHSLQKR